MIQESVTYKSTGIDWLGDIPSHWEVRRLKFCIKGLVSGGTPSMDNTEYWQQGHIPWVSPKDMKVDEISDSEMKVTTKAIQQTNLKLLPVNSILMVVRSGILQRTLPIAITKAESTINQDIKAIVLDETIYNYNYFFALLRGLEDYILTSCRKAVATVDSIEIPYFLNLLLPIPPLDEQVLIVSHLDTRTAQINAFLAQKQRFIDLLREQKQAIINEAVTKGIYPQNPLDKHVTEHAYLTDFEDAPWLPDVPGHWEVTNLTKFFTSIVDYRGKTPTKTDSGVFLVTAKNIRNGAIDYEISKEYVSEEEYDEIMRRGKPELNDILFTTEAPLGQVALVDKVDIALAQRVIKFRCNELVIPEFIRYWIISSTFQYHLQTFATGSTAEGIKASKLNSLKLLRPPLAEQADIVVHIEREIGRIDGLIRRTEREMGLMREYRTALVAEAVTGKKAP